MLFFFLSAGRPIKGWNKDGFRDSAAFCLSNGYTPVLAGSVEEFSMAKEICLEGMINLVPKEKNMDVENFCRVSLGSSAVVGPDTGLVHLSDALNVPVIGLYGPTRPYKFAPYNNQELVGSTNHTSKSMNDISPRDVNERLKEIFRIRLDCSAERLGFYTSM